MICSVQTRGLETKTGDTGYTQMHVANLSLLIILYLVLHPQLYHGVLLGFRFKIVALHSTLMSKDQAAAFTVPPAGVRKVLCFVNFDPETKVFFLLKLTKFILLIFNLDCPIHKYC